jgi:predicted phosphodiesterase
MLRSPSKLQIAVLSDLHLGRKNALDRFAHKTADAEARFVELLDHLERSVDQIVLLGDIFETLKGKAPGTAKLELKAALASYPEIAKRILDSKRYRYIFGNHDTVAGSALQAPEYVELKDNGLNLLFFHGHQLDPLANGRALLSRAGVWLGGWIERLGWHMTPEDHQMKDSPSWRSAPEYFAQEAVAVGRAHGADIVVTGHTHRAVREEIDGTLFLNSGTCVAGRREMLLIDTTAKTFDVVTDPSSFGVSLLAG